MRSPLGRIQSLISHDLPSCPRSDYNQEANSTFYIDDRHCHFHASHRISSGFKIVDRDTSCFQPWATHDSCNKSTPVVCNFEMLKDGRSVLSPPSNMVRSLLHLVIRNMRRQSNSAILPDPSREAHETPMSARFIRQLPGDAVVSCATPKAQGCRNVRAFCFLHIKRVHAHETARGQVFPLLMRSKRWFGQPPSDLRVIVERHRFLRCRALTFVEFGGRILVGPFPTIINPLKIYNPFEFRSSLAWLSRHELQEAVQNSTFGRSHIDKAMAPWAFAQPSIASFQVAN